MIRPPRDTESSWHYWLGLATMCLAAGAYACGDSENTGGSGGAGAGCPEGVICSSGGGGNGSGNGSSTGGDASDGAGPAGGNGGAGGGPGCVEAWECTPWESNPPGSDNGVRVCTDKNACGTTGEKPVEVATLPALDLELYKCDVEPIFDRTCSMMGCHGTDSRGLRVYSRGRFRNVAESVVNPCPGGGMTPLANCLGSIECGCWLSPHTDTEWQRNFDAARGFLLDEDGVQYADVDDSDLVQQPAVEGGKAHAGIKTYNIGSADYDAIHDWLSGTPLGGDGVCNTNN